MLTVVLVDDEYYALEGLKNVLENFQEVKIMGMYEDGRTALEKISIIKPNIAFVDIEMPGMDGLELFRKISVQSPKTKIVFVTGYYEYAEKAFEVGAADYIIKPVCKERLIKTLERM